MNITAKAKVNFVLYAIALLQCVPKKRTTYFQTAVTPLRIVEIKKVGRDSERARADLSDTYNYFSVTQLGAEIFEIKIPFEEIVNIFKKNFWHCVNFNLHIPRKASFWQLLGVKIASTSYIS